EAMVSSTQLKDNDGDVSGLVLVISDISERKKIEQQLRVSEEKFRLLVGNVKDYAIFMLNTDGTIASWNDGAEKIKGYARSEIIGKHFSIFYLPEDITQHEPENNLKEVNENGRFESKGWRRRKDGSVFWAHVIFTAIYDENGNHNGYAKITRDITEQKE